MDNLQITSITPHNKQIPLELLINYSEKGLSLVDIGKQVGCTHSNISQRFKSAGYIPEHFRAYKESRADIMAFVGSKMLLSLTDADIQKMAPRDRVVSYGILHDKEMIERRGAATGLADPGPLGSMVQDIAAIATRSPQVFNTIIQVVGSLPDNIRDIVTRLLPVSHATNDADTNIVDMPVTNR